MDNTVKHESRICRKRTITVHEDINVVSVAKVPLQQQGATGGRRDKGLGGDGAHASGDFQRPLSGHMVDVLGILTVPARLPFHELQETSVEIQREILTVRVLDERGPSAVVHHGCFGRFSVFAGMCGAWPTLDKVATKFTRSAGTYRNSAHVWTSSDPAASCSASAWRHSPQMYGPAAPYTA